MKDGNLIVSTIRTQSQCKTPAENYDFAAVITARFGTEAGLRIQRLLSTDFADSSITPKDREMLRFMAREMLWIPVPIEEKIGSALLISSGSELTVLEDDAANKPMWDQTVQVVRELSAAAPPNPFSIRLILLQKGSPGSLAGGVIFVDNKMLKSVFDDEPPSVGKLRFVLAHELAHIHRRHRAKRIQQLLVDSDSGLKLMRQIVARARSGGSDFTPAALSAWIETVSAVQDVAKDLFNFHAKYEQSQEYEADACATALMIDAKAGDPLSAFQAYRADVEKQPKLPVTSAADSAGASLNTHPPNAAREAKIKEKVVEYRTKEKVVGAMDAAFSGSAAASAAAATGKVKSVGGKVGATTSRSSAGAGVTVAPAPSGRAVATSSVSSNQVRSSASSASSKPTTK